MTRDASGVNQVQQNFAHATHLLAKQRVGTKYWAECVVRCVPIQINGRCVDLATLDPLYRDATHDATGVHPALKKTRTTFGQNCSVNSDTNMEVTNDMNIS